MDDGPDEGGLVRGEGDRSMVMASAGSIMYEDVDEGLRCLGRDGYESSGDVLSVEFVDGAFDDGRPYG